MPDYGFLLVDKPAGITSFDVIYKLRRLTGIRKIGHTGTLDPFATGLLLVAIGRATRYLAYLTEDRKTYQAVLQLGKTTDTGDITGVTVCMQEPEICSTEELKSLPDKVLAITSQVPPQYSAIKINGIRAYKHARANETVEIPARDIVIYNFRILDYKHPLLTYSATVSKGTYIRTLSEAIASFLGQIATTCELRRTTVGEIEIAKSVTLEQLTPENWQNHVHPISEILHFMPQVEIDAEQTSRYKHGLSILMPDREEAIYLVLHGCNLLGLGEIRGSFLYPKRVLA